MKKKYSLIILFIIFLIPLIACNSEGLVMPSIETENMDFKEVVASLDTPEKLVEYMRNNFNHYVTVYGEPLDDYNPYLPEDFFQVRIGNCEDFSAFASYVLDHHDYNVFLLYYIALSNENNKIYGHTVTVFYTQEGKLKYISNLGSSNGKTQFGIFGPFSTVEEIIAREELRIKGQVFLHGFTCLGSIGEQLEPLNFEEAISQLTNPQKILNYMTRNFEFKTDFSLSAQSPQQLFQTKQGNRFDFAVFVSYLLDYHNYDAKMLRLEFTENSAVDGCDIVVIYYDENNKLRAISHHGKQVMRISEAYNSVDELIINEENVRSIINSSEVKVYRYGFLSPGTTNLMPVDWITI